MTFKSQQDQHNVNAIQKSEPNPYREGGQNLRPDARGLDQRYGQNSQSMGGQSSWDKRASANTISQMTNPFRTNAYGLQDMSGLS